LTKTRICSIRLKMMCEIFYFLASSRNYRHTSKRFLMRISSITSILLGNLLSAVLMATPGLLAAKSLLTPTAEKARMAGEHFQEKIRAKSIDRQLMLRDTLLKI